LRTDGKYLHARTRAPTHVRQTPHARWPHSKYMKQEIVSAEGKLSGIHPKQRLAIELIEPIRT
jgi:hypothetical protein